jgi:hypothetical protein
MERTTLKQLECMVDRINAVKGFDKPEYNTIGSYHLSGAYGGYQLQKVCNEAGGIHAITSGHIPKRELYYQLRAYLDGLTD